MSKFATNRDRSIRPKLHHSLFVCSTGISNLLCDYVHQQQQWRTVEMIELSNNRIVKGILFGNPHSNIKNCGHVSMNNL